MNVSDATENKAHIEPLHLVSQYASQIRVVHVVSLLLLAFVADYAWMLYMRWRMVRTSAAPSHCVDQNVASGTISVANLR
jgi:hypothetical protein